MSDRPQNPHLRHVTLFCVLLLALAGLAQALHVHPQDAPRGDADKTRCSLCLAGDAPQEAIAKVDVVPAQPSESAAVGALQGHLPSVSRRTERIRPPPAA